MSTVTNTSASGALGNIARAVRSVSITVPAGRRARAAALAEARRIYGFDLSDEERADRVRHSHGR